MFADARGGHEVERAGAETVLRPGQCTDRANLDGVPGEVRLERLILVNRHLLERRPFEHLDERIAGDLLRKSGAPRAEDAPLAVQQHLRGDGDRFWIGAFDVMEPGLGVPVGHRLVLQRALAALVADRAIQRVVDEQQLNDAVLGLLGDRRSVLGAHHHALGHRRRAGGERLSLSFHLDQTLPAGADRVKKGVLAEPRNLNAEHLRGSDDQGALRHRNLKAVNGERHQLRRRRRRCRSFVRHRHQTPAPAKTVDATGSNGQPPCS